MSIIDTLRGRLIVSVQVHRDDDPMGRPDAMIAVAQSVVAAGAGGIRCGGITGPDSIRAISNAVDVPVIGLWKVGETGRFITPRVEHAVAVADAGANIVAFDATNRPRPARHTTQMLIAAINGAGSLAMADISSVDEALEAMEQGADLIATTLSGYVGSRIRTDDGPDLELVAAIARLSSVPVIAEGRFTRPHEVHAALEAGAHAVVVGRAISSPYWLTSTFVDALGGNPQI